MANVTAKSVVVNVKRNWIDNDLGQVGIRRIEFQLDSTLIKLPGYAKGGLYGIGSDSFDNALEVTGSIGAAQGSIIGYTMEPSESHGGYPVTASAWYKWTAPVSGTVYFDTLDTQSTTVLAVYTGDSIGTLTQIAITFNTKPSGSLDGDWGYLQFNAVEGQEYKIAVSSTATGTIVRFNYAQFETYASGSSALQPQGAFRVYGKKTYEALTNSWKSSSGTCDLITGYTVEDFVRITIVFAETIEFNKIRINNFHDNGADTDIGVQECDFYISQERITQAVAEDITSDIEGGLLLLSLDSLTQHTGVNDEEVFTEYEVFAPEPPAQPYAATVNASLGISSEVSTSNGIQGSAAMNCGLALASVMTAGATSSPAKLMAALAFCSNMGSITGYSVKSRTGMCLTCMMHAGAEVHRSVLNAAFLLGSELHAEQPYEADSSACFALSSSISALNGNPPCLAEEFKHIKWF